MSSLTSLPNDVFIEIYKKINTNDKLSMKRINQDTSSLINKNNVSYVFPTNKEFVGDVAYKIWRALDTTIVVNIIVYNNKSPVGEIHIDNNMITMVNSNPNQTVRISKDKDKYDDPDKLQKFCNGLEIESILIIFKGLSADGVPNQKLGVNKMLIKMIGDLSIEIKKLQSENPKRINYTYTPDQQTIKIDFLTQETQTQTQNGGHIKKLISKYIKRK